MAITSIGYDGPIDEVGFAQMMPSIGASEYGVVGPGDWKVTAHPSTAQAVNVATGKGWGRGVFDTSDTIVTVQCDPISSGTRWDLVAARRNWQPVNGTTAFGAIAGGSNKEMPARLTQPGSQDDQPIALVQWTAGQTQPTAIVDLRVWAGDGGVFAKDDLVRSYLSSIGTEVSINGVVWSLGLGANDVPVWVSQSVDSVSLSAPDAGWSVTGGLVRTRTPGGLTLVTMACRVTRATAPAGGAFPIGGAGGTFASLLAGFIPAGWRPAVVTDMRAVVNNPAASSSSGGAEPVARVGTDGTVAMRPAQGYASGSGDAGWFFHLQGSWFV